MPEAVATLMAVALLSAMVLFTRRGPGEVIDHAMPPPQPAELPVMKFWMIWAFVALIMPMPPPVEQGEKPIAAALPLITLFMIVGVPAPLRKMPPPFAPAMV